MRAGTVTATVLLVNSPHAEDAMRRWREEAIPGELGWHPCLTMDAPTANPEEVGSLLGHDGNLLPLGKFLARLMLGRIRYSELVRELDCQYRRFLSLTGHPPVLVNGHKHIHIFPGCSEALIEVLERHRTAPHVRRIREPLSTMWAVPGARCKRTFLSCLGRLAARRQQRAGLPGNDWLAGITDPPWIEDPDFFARWLRHIPGRTVELMVHPGHMDSTLLGRDCMPGDGLQQRRVVELRQLSQPEFREACHRAGFILTGNFSGSASRENVA
jgi:predicted glycoside hydrolase/deacetylase ChbG (UPF0249 family)